VIVKRKSWLRPLTASATMSEIVPEVDVLLLHLSVLIPSLQGDNAITARIGSVPAGYVSSIVLGELYFGAYGSPTCQEAALLPIS
jgi:hypothetical protein